MKEKKDNLHSRSVSYLTRLPAIERIKDKTLSPLIAGILLLAAFIWSYWPGIVHMWNIWQRSDEYSAGLLVPFLAIYILYLRRNSIENTPLKASLWGLFAFIAAQAVRFFGLAFMYSSLERLSIVLSLIALTLLICGWKMLQKVLPILLFMFLMLPWPNSVQAMIAMPLQNWATSSAVFCLELIGYDIIREGNIIHIGQTTVAVAEACNGLRMITAFFVISGMVVLLVDRKWWEKLIILISCLPVALLCNTVRLVVTSIAFTFLKGQYWEGIFHDFGGYAMMPLALALLVFELYLIRQLTTPPQSTSSIIVTKKTSA